MRAPTAEEQLTHDVGALVLGVTRPSADLFERVAGHWLEPLARAVRDVHGRSSAWPVDVGDLLDELRSREALDPLGGWPGIHRLMRDASDRILTAQKLGEIEGCAVFALLCLRREKIAEERTLDSIAEYKECRARANAALAELEALAKGRAA